MGRTRVKLLLFLGYKKWIRVNLIGYLNMLFLLSVTMNSMNSGLFLIALYLCHQARKGLFCLVLFMFKWIPFYWLGIYIYIPKLLNGCWFYCVIQAAALLLSLRADGFIDSKVAIGNRVISSLKIKKELFYYLFFRCVRKCISDKSEVPAFLKVSSFVLFFLKWHKILSVWKTVASHGVL